MFKQSEEKKKNLAVSSTVELGLGEDDAGIDEINVGPVISLGALAVNTGSRVRNSGPEAAAADILLPGITLSVEDQLTVRNSKTVVVHCLQGPLADEVRELGRLGDEGGLTADSGSDVLGVGTSSSEVVDVRIDDEVGRGVEVRLPEGSALEAVLKHDGDAAVDLCDTGKGLGGVVGDPLSTLGGETSRSSEAREVVRGLVDGCDSP